MASDTKSILFALSRNIWDVHIHGDFVHYGKAYLAVPVSVKVTRMDVL